MSRRRNAEKILGKSLSRAFKRAGKKLKLAKKDPSPERLHELRKIGKDVREQLRILRPLAPDKIDELEGKLDDLCDELGEARDIYLVRNLLFDVVKNWPVGKSLIKQLQDEAVAKNDKFVKKGLKHAREATTGSPKSIKRLIVKRWKP